MPCVGLEHPIHIENASDFSVSNLQRHTLSYIFYHNTKDVKGYERRQEIMRRRVRYIGKALLEKSARGIPLVWRIRQLNGIRIPECNGGPYLSNSPLCPGY
ncbi:hypothetical protein TWF730_003934 [Orbilia blumenaviensis]|uniref:Uncharacterized protein n=1 Tax=Orbilia blumenaviensis TaxID=1796055 RepID=A0AAV9U1P4_9PEZI